MHKVDFSLSTTLSYILLGVYCISLVKCSMNASISIHVSQVVTNDLLGHSLALQQYLLSYFKEIYLFNSLVADWSISRLRSQSLLVSQAVLLACLYYSTCIRV